MRNKFFELNLMACLIGLAINQNAMAVDNLIISTEPLAVSTEKVEPNVVLVMDTSGSMGSRVSGTNKTRMQVAREVAKDVIDDVQGVRFGMFNLDLSRRYEGGSISYRSEGDRWNRTTYYAECGALSKERLKFIVDGLTASGNTPVAETLYEVTRYYRGLKPLFGDNNGALGEGGRYKSPIQYRCQKNYAVVISDGLPTSDTSVPNNNSDDPKGPNGQNPENWAGSAGNSRYSLDDVAMFANDIDFLSTGTDIKGGSWDDPSFKQQNMQTYTIGFALDDDLLRQTAALGGGQSWVTNNADELKEALTSALSDIAARSLSSSSPAASSGIVQTANIFFPSYSSLDWSGELTKVDEDGDEVWKASTRIPSHSNRKIFFNDSGAAKTFIWNNIKNTGFATYFDNARKVGSDGSTVLNYLRGDRQYESAAEYRRRNSLLGDIVNSSPVFVGEPNFRYPMGLESTPYSDFKTSMKNREEMVYVGSNDGMLHGFNSSGVEKFAFIPQEVIHKLPELSNTNYTHRYFVDGSPTVIDAFIKANGTGSKQWRSVLVSGLNAGGQSVFAVDVTNPNALSGNSFLWEFTDPDLGYSFSRPAISRLADGTWVAIFGNGYNNTQKSYSGDNLVSATGNAVLFVVDLETGVLIKKIDTGIGFDDDPVAGRSRPNGLGTVAPVDHNQDSIVDYVYAGDLFGNLWKFDLTPKNEKNPSNLKMEVAFNGNPLFKAKYTESGNTYYQPILVAPDARPTVTRNPKGGFMVYFGTGKYIETIDRSLEGAGKQSFYAIWDKNGDGNTTPVSGRGVLQEQSIIYEGAQAFGGNINEVRVTSNNAVNWGAKLGWYMDFNQSTPNYERVITTPTIRNGKVIFPTTIPLLKDDPCDSDSDSWVMDLDALTGSRLTYSPFDMNDDKTFDRNDFYSDGVNSYPLSGVKFNEALPKPVISADEDNEVKIFSQQTQFIENKGVGFEDRQSWREVLEE